MGIDEGLKTQASHAELAHLSAAELRMAIRAGRYRGHTAGLAAGSLQCNLVILPGAHAQAFERYCERNPRPCPLVGKSRPGDPGLPMLGSDIDVRSDVPQYNVYEHGERVATLESIDTLWQQDMVVFALGCSFTFERALTRAGIGMRHIEADLTVPMFKSNIETVPAAPFAGPMVVSMRPIARDLVALAASTSARYPHAHGAPVHAGDPAEIGIKDLAAPDFGDAVLPMGDEVPVFWACGVTPHAAIEQARVPLCITHTPGRMLVTDREEAVATA